MLVGTASIDALMQLQATATIDRYLPDCRRNSTTSPAFR